MFDNHLNKEDKGADGVKHQNRSVLIPSYLRIDKHRIEQYHRQDKLVIEKYFPYPLFHAAKVLLFFEICKFLFSPLAFFLNLYNPTCRNRFRYDA